MKITILTTGGTIDSYSDLTQDGKIVPAQKSLVINFLKNLKPYFSFSYKPICLKDSRDITKEDRERILKEILASKNQYILITHGTYTMPETARFLEKHNLKEKVIILTGSMSTLIGTINSKGGLVPSDGSFNLGFAIASFNYLKPGVYLSMNGKVFASTHIKKDSKNLRFFEKK